MTPAAAPPSGTTHGWSRWGERLRTAWASRQSLSGPSRSAEERAFLPDALSLQETPPHPAPRLAAWVICSLFIAALAWAWASEVDVVAVASGRIIVADRSKLIQPLEIAQVRTIHVRDGDTVQAGQLLLELDPTGPAAERGRTIESMRAAAADALIAQALLGQASGRTATLETAAFRQLLDDWSPEDTVAANERLASEQQDHLARVAQLDADIGRRLAELDTARAVAARLAATLPHARQRSADYRHLTEQGFVSDHARQDRARELTELERDLSTAHARVAEAQAGVVQSRLNRRAHLAESRRAWQTRLAQARLRSAELKQEYTKANARQAQTRLVAPVNGTVQQLSVHTAGGVVTPAQTLMVIVPEGTTESSGPIAEVNIENKDIGFVRAGQTATVKLETFNYTRYGTVPASVQWVTADAVPTAGPYRDAPLGAQSQAVFPARLTLARHALDVDGKQVMLTPGLNLTAEVKLGKRRVIGYLLSPLQRTVGESLRER